MPKAHGKLLATPSPMRTRTYAHTFAGRGSLLFYMAVLAYATLNPFVGWRLPDVISIFNWPKYVTLFDITANVIAYLPLGALLATWCYRRLQWSPLLSWCCAMLAGGAYSLALELLQLFLPARISSPLDVIANTSGAALGAALLLLPLGRQFITVINLWRLRHFAHRNSTDIGLLLLVIWFMTQLNPAIPFFEAGLMSPNDTTPGVLTAAEMADNSAAAIAAHQHAYTVAYDPLVLLPQAVGIGLNVGAFALFVSLLLHPKKRVFVNVCAVLLVGLMAKLVMSALMLKTPQLAATLSPATVIGLTAGLLLFVFFSKRRYRWRAFWATLLVFAGGVMSKLSSVYAALDEALRLFNWPHGQLANFASLTHWLNEIWPLAALLFLATIFIRTNQSD